MLCLAGVSATYPGGAGVDDLDLSVDGGEVVALVGLNGAGKTTLMRLALGMVRPSSGAVRVLGEPPARLRSRWSEVGYLLATPLAYPELTVAENLRLACRLQGCPLERAAESVTTWRLGQVVDRRFRRLSLGTRQRVGLAAALQHHPRLVVLDEPSTALDPSGVLELRDQLRERAHAGAAVLVSSHHLDEVSRIADRILVMNRGRLVGSLDPGAPDLERRFFEVVLADDELRSRASPEPT